MDTKVHAGKPYDLGYEHAGPRKGKKELVIALDPEVHAKLKQLREDDGRSMNLMISEAITEWLERNNEH